ncbi:hypothetical protein K1719_038725 [Acacia pycnantha]|nr:hypothetical protein K1719_045056 [Acacia pycnantha]KAI9079324.1 hypothetical protein K1719_038725 [Acacia pycnantha]
MEGKKVVMSIFVAWLVLHLASMQCEAKVSDFWICFISCIPKCAGQREGLWNKGVCTAGCWASCLGSDHRITTRTQYSCSVGCAHSSCSHLISTEGETDADKLNSCVDGCITGCVKN